MDVKTLRRVCAELLRELNLRVPAAPEELYTALCEGMARRHTRPVTYRLVAFPAGTVSGLWVASEHQHLVLCEKYTAPEHQLVILGHEFWHLEKYEGQVEPVDAADVSKLTDPDAAPGTVKQIATRLAARTDFCEHDEAEAEFFGSILGSRTRRWLLHGATSGPADGIPRSTVGLVRRLETSLSHPSRQEICE